MHRCLEFPGCAQMKGGNMRVQHVSLSIPPFRQDQAKGWGTHRVGSVLTPHFNLAPALRTTNHLPSRFSRRSIQTNSPLVSFPPWLLFSLTVALATATLPYTCTSTGPFSNHWSLSWKDSKSVRRVCLVMTLPEETVAKS